MKTSDFDYCLPPDLIAQTPAEPRDSSRLLVLQRSSGRIEHSRFYLLGEQLRAGDLLVLNNSRVIPARFHARQKSSQRSVEFLLLRKMEPRTWQAIGRPGRRLKIGEHYLVEASAVEVEVVEHCEDNTFVLELSTEEGMKEWGQVPLPPYIRKPPDNMERYQTIYAREPGSVAAPTAGLHFTRELMEGLSSQGVSRVYVTLHVGLDTFRPMKEADPRRHKIHTEYFRLDPVVAAIINSTKREGGRIVAIGTTSVRTLEQASLWSRARGKTELTPTSGWADLLILPGHRFRLVDGMVTNFHLPRSTTLMMTAAIVGQELLMAAYQAAIEERYRFYSFGDGMLIL